LLPGWFRFFAWLYVVAGVANAGVIFGGALVGASSGGGLYLDIFGQRYQGPLRDWQPLAMAVVAGGISGVALTLLWGWRHGRILGLVCLYAYIFVSIVAMAVALRQGHVTISLSVLLLLVPILTLHRLKTKWNASPGQPPMLGNWPDMVTR
jgi:hypothetical protein